MTLVNIPLLGWEYQNLIYSGLQEIEQYLDDRVDSSYYKRQQIN